MDINSWLFLPQIWLIIAIAFLLLEMMDTSMIFFLPLSLAAAMISFLHIELMMRLGSDYLLADSWYGIGSQWMLLGVAFSFGLVYAKKWLRVRQTARHGQNDGSDDINDY